MISAHANQQAADFPESNVRGLAEIGSLLFATKREFKVVFGL